MTSYKTLVLTGPFGIPTATNRSFALVAGSSASALFVAYENENWSTRTVRTAGSFDTLAVKRGGGAGGTDTVTFRQNFSNTSLAVTTTNSTDLQSTTASISVSVGDAVSFDGSASVARQWIRTLFNPSADNTQVSIFGTRGNGCGFAIGAWLASSDGTNYLAFCGGAAPCGNLITNESLVRTKLKSAGSFRNVSVKVVRNTATSAVTLRGRVNGVSGNISITIPAGTEGVFSDTSNSDACAINDEFNFSCSAPSSGRVEFSEMYCEYAHSVINGLHDIFCGRPGQTVPINASSGATYYVPAGDLVYAGGATEANEAITIGMTSGAQKFRMVVTTNTCTADQVWTVMKNGAETALTFTVPAGVTGEFIDDVNQISLSSTDTMSVRQTGGGTGALGVQYFALLIPGAESSPPTPEPTEESAFGYYIERMDNRVWQTIEQAWCLDSALSYPMPEPDATLTVSSATGEQNITEYNLINGGSGYTAPIGQVVDRGGTGSGATLDIILTNGVITTVSALATGSGYSAPAVEVLDSDGIGAVIQPIVTNYVTCSTNTSSFTSSDVGSIIRVGGGKLEIITVSSTTSVIANVISPITYTVPNDPNNTPVPATSGNWSMTAPTMTVSGLHHLEGLTVAALADGGVVRDLVVTDGAVTLPVEATQIVVGLPFVVQLQTMYMDAGAGPTVQTRRKELTQAVLRVEASRAPEIGANQPDAAAQPNQAEIPWGGVPYTAMTQIKDRTPAMFAGQPVPLFSGDLDITNVFTTWDAKAQIAVQQRDPVPLTVTAIVPWVKVGDTPGQ